MNNSKIENFIDEMTTLDEVSSEMKKIGKNYIVSEQLEARFLADWMYRFGIKIDEIIKLKTNQTNKDLNDNIS